MPSKSKLSTITEEKRPNATHPGENMAGTTSPESLPPPIHAADALSPVHPGEILLEEFLRPLKMSVYDVAKRMNVPNTRMHEIVRERRSVTADTALRLAHVFGTSPEFWMALQTTYDLQTTEVDVGRLRPVTAAPSEAVVTPTVEGISGLAAPPSDAGETRRSTFHSRVQEGAFEVHRPASSFHEGAVQAKKSKTEPVE